MRNIVPAGIQEMLLAGRRRSSERGCVLLLDVSGFTPLAEALMPGGRSGAAALSRILNGVLSRAVEIVHRAGGVVGDFEGDAIHGVFPEDRTRSALLAAGEISRYFRLHGTRSTPIGDRTLTARISLATGSLEWGIAGTARLVHYLGGSALQRARETARSCAPGEVRLHPRMTVSDEVPEPPVPSVMGIRRSTALRFAPEAVVSATLAGEFRQVTPVFLEFSSLRADSLRDVADRLTEMLATSGGHLAGLYPGRSGRARALALFGAPIARENDARRACDFALRAVAELGAATRCGLASGMVYAGMVGGRGRCAYTVLGDPVNVASRIASIASPGEVLAETGVLREVPGYDREERGPLPVRGRDGEVGVVRLTGVGGGTAGPGDAGELVGREPELSYLLQRVLPQPPGSSAGLTLLYGSPGIGKSRLLAEIRSMLPAGSRVLSAVCDDVPRRSLGPFVQFLRGLPRFEDPAREPGTGFATGSPQAAAGDDPAGEAHSSLETLEALHGLRKGAREPDPGPEAVAHGFSWLLRRLCSEGPLLLVIDDIQWLDDDSRRLLRLLAGILRPLPVSILAAGRPLDDGSRPTVGIENAIETRALDLGGLSAGASRQLARELLGCEPGDRLMDLVGERALGNPLYIGQFCLYLREAGLLVQEEDRCELARGRVDLPSGIRSILVARIDRLSPGLRDLAQAAAVIGREFTAEMLAAVGPRSDPGPLLREGERERIWSRVSGDLYAFDHVLYRDAAYGMLLGRRLRTLHARAAEALIARAPDEGASVAAAVALHLEGAGDPTGAVAWGWKALCSAVEGHGSTEALEWADRLAGWLEDPSCSPEPPDLLADVLLRKSGVLDRLGDRERQAATLERLAVLVESRGWSSRRARVLQAQGTLAYLTGRIEEARAFYSEGLTRARELGDRTIEGSILGNMGILRNLQGLSGEAMGCYRQALDIHREVGNRGAEGNVLGNIAILERLMGDMDRAETHYHEALAIHRETGNTGGEASVLGGIGNLMKDRGRWDEALAFYRDAVSLSRAAGDRRYEASVLSNIGNLEAKRGNPAEAAAFFARALEIHRRIGNLNGEADTLLMAGNMHLASERLDDAAASFLEVLSICGRTVSLRRECHALCRLGLVHAARGEIREAVSCYGETLGKAKGGAVYEEIVVSLAELRSALLERGIRESELPEVSVSAPS